jgi:hypothetical protein
MIRGDIAFAGRIWSSRMAIGATPAPLRLAGLLVPDTRWVDGRLRPAVFPLQCRGPAPPRQSPQHPRESGNVFSKTR